MQLRDYLHQRQITQAAFGRLLDPPVSQGKVNHWLRGTRRVSLVEAVQIERITDGEVRPHDWVPATNAPTAAGALAGAAA